MKPEDEEFEMSLDFFIRAKGKPQYWAKLKMDATDRQALQTMFNKMAANNNIRAMMQKAILSTTVTQN